MIGITFPGSDQDVEILSAVRACRPVGDIAQEFELDAEYIVALYEEYLAHRKIIMDSDHARLIREGYLDRLDSLVERYAESAAQGNINAARFVLAAVSTIASLQERFAKIDAIRRLAPPVPVSDAQKEATSDYERHAQRYHDLVKACAELGIPVPQEATRAYRELLSEHEGVEG
jgi:hypothetical protein